jgi:uncharacterized membrane protein (UPF0127 family)
LENKVIPRWFRWMRLRCEKILHGEDNPERPHNPCEGRCSVTTEDDGLFQAINVSKGVVVACRVEWAGTSEARKRGLLGRDHIDSGEGAYIVPTQWIHMFGMRFPIDVAFLDSEGQVLHLCRALNPNRLSPIVWRAEGALELAAGTLEATNTEIGDVIEFR